MGGRAVECGRHAARIYFQFPRPQTRAAPIGRRRVGQGSGRSRGKGSNVFEGGNDHANWYFLPASNEVIWFSERDNWGQLYLYDLKTGALKNQITSGEGNVSQLLKVDEKNRL